MSTRSRILAPFCVAIVFFAFVATVASRVKAGRLSSTTSVYLLSHADDAIDWHPWGRTPWKARGARTNRSS